MRERVSITGVGVVSPIYVAMGADFRKAFEGSYQTTTLTLELVTQ